MSIKSISLGVLLIAVNFSSFAQKDKIRCLYSTKYQVLTYEKDYDKKDGCVICFTDDYVLLVRPGNVIQFNVVQPLDRFPYEKGLISTLGISESELGQPRGNYTIQVYYGI